ncbi:protein fuzzy homolog isoform X2 [Antechinus flavipes]|uniref:protein fuzzy homolog isoform X2 n=1 Tax=Antechinus flavipes TaxID=38775 RepID=UPI00223587FF|nr:protein fuzzy homolog isoform X2 [Antechinus flavipes]
MAEDGTSGAVHLLCLASSSGVPLFCRSSRGGAPSRQQLPFSVIGSLNGVHMFGQNLDVTLRSARTEDTAVVWKTFHDSVTLIVLSSEPGCSELRLERLLELVFGAMVLLVGLEELTRIRNVERLKKELRATYGLIDSLLGDAELAGDLTQCVDCIAPEDGPLLQEALAGFAEEVGSVFASLVVGGRVVVGTEGWWRLGSPEAVLLPWLVGTLPAQAARDYPVYLPHGSPTVPHRLLTLMLLPGLELCVLCGPQPSLSQLEPQVLERWWQPMLEPLRACLALAPRAIPAGFSLHPDILGISPPGSFSCTWSKNVPSSRWILAERKVLPPGPAGASSAPSMLWSLPPTSPQRRGHQRKRPKSRGAPQGFPGPATWCPGRLPRGRRAGRTPGLGSGWWRSRRGPAASCCW